MSRPTRVTAADVAREAGVSTATVSYVLNNTPDQKISEATSKRVRETAERLGYVRNRAALALARGDSGIVLVDFSVFPRSETADQAIQGFISRLEDEGCTVLRTWWGPQNWEQHLIPLASATNASAVITAVPVSGSTRTALEQTGVRAISSLLPAPEQLVMPLQMAGAAQVAYLAAQGHDHLLYAPDLAPELAMLDELRSVAIARTAADHGIRWSALEVSDSVDGYREALERSRADIPNASAICAYNDDVALKCLSALQALGVAVPTEMAVIGVDNLPFTASTYPPLTTVDYRYSMADIDSETLTRLLDPPGTGGRADDIQTAISVEVIVRAST